MQLSPLTKRNRSNDIFLFNLETNTHTSLIQKYTRNSTQKSWQIKQQTNWIIFTQKKFWVINIRRSKKECFMTQSNYVWDCRILGCTDLRTKGFALQSFTPHPLESHIERKPPHFLPYKLWSQGSSVPPSSHI